MKSMKKPMMGKGKAPNPFMERMMGAQPAKKQGKAVAKGKPFAMGGKVKKGC